jgi:hypothetical protein
LHLLIEAENEEAAHEKKDFPVGKEVIISTLLEWGDCDEVEQFEDK